LAAANRLAARLLANEQAPTHERSWRMIQRGTQQLLQCVRPFEARIISGRAGRASVSVGPARAESIPFRSPALLDSLRIRLP
jgi:hypothetical protein